MPRVAPRHGRSRASAAEICPLLLDGLEHGIVHPVQHVAGCGRGDGVAPEGSAVGAGGEDIAALLSRHHAAEGQAAGDAFGEGDCVRLDAVLLEGTDEYSGY